MIEVKNVSHLVFIRQSSLYIFFPSKNRDLAWYFTVKLATQPENYK